MTYAPIVNGEFSLRIIDLYPAKNEIILSDTSRWKIYSKDQYLLNEWAIGDYVIIGTNNSWFGLSNIIINCSLYDYTHVRAQQY